MKTYYVTQTFTDSGISGVDEGWRNNYYKYDDFATASKAYRDIIIQKPDYDIRLIKAFFCEKNQKQIIREILEFKRKSPK